MQVVEDRNSVDHNQSDAYNSSFTSYDLKIQYFAAQRFGNPAFPTICKLYFYVEGFTQVLQFVLVLTYFGDVYSDIYLLFIRKYLS